MESRSDLLSTLDPGSHGDQQTANELSHSVNQSNTTKISLVTSSPVIDDTITIAYQDHFDVWPQAEYLFKYLTRFDLKLSRNLKLESLNEQLMKGTGHEDLHVTVKCQYVSLPVGAKTQDVPEVHRCCKGKENSSKHEVVKGHEDDGKVKENPHNHGGSDDELPTKENEEETKDEVDLDIGTIHPDAYSKDTEHLLRVDENLLIANKDANYPYLHLFLIPPSSLSDYKKEIKPKMKDFISSRMENKLNEEFLIVAFLNKSSSSSSSDGTKEGAHKRKSKLGLGRLTGGKEGEDRRVVEKVRMRLFKQKLRSRLVVVTLDPIDNTDAENSGIKHTEPLITSAIRESGIDKMMRTLLNLSLNKRYLYILINVNKMFLPFLSASTAGANAHSGSKTNGPSGDGAETEGNKEAATATNTNVGSGISSLTVGSYLEFVDALENLCNLFYKIQLTLESVVLYEFLLYNEHFGKLLSLFKAAKVDEGFYRSYNVLNSYSSAYYSTLSCSQGSSAGYAGTDNVSSIAKYCYVRYRLYILSKQLLMLNTITTSTQNFVGIDRLSIGTEATDIVSRATTSALDGVVTMPSSTSMGTNSAGSFENLSFLPVLLTYNFINDVYFQVIGSRAILSFPTSNMFCPESGDYVIPTDTGVAPATRGDTVRRIKWLMLTTIELIRHLENKLNTEFLDDASNDDNYLGEVVRGKKKKFRFLKSIFKTGGSGSGSKGSGHTKGSSTGGITSGNIAWVVKSYYGIKFTENPYKYVSFIYLVLYKLVLQLASATSGGSTTVTATTVDGPKYDEEGLEVYIDSVYDKCIRLHYANITADNKTQDKHLSTTNTTETGVSAGSLMRTIDQMLDQIVDYKVAIIERCSRYFILSNLQSYSNVLRSYYLKPNASGQSLDAAESTLGEDTGRATDSDWMPKGELQVPLNTEDLLSSDITNTDRTLTTDRSTSSMGTEKVDGEGRLGTSVAVKKSIAPGIKMITEMLGKEQQKTGKVSSTIRDTKDSDDEEGQQGDRRVHCSLSNCNEYDHLFNKTFKRSSVKTLSLYPSCYNYIHVHLTKKSSEKLEGELYLHMSTVRSYFVSSINRLENAGRFGGGAEGSMLEVDMCGLTVINLDNKVVNISLDSGHPDSSSSNSNSGCGSPLSTSMGAIKLPDFTNRIIVCVPLKLCDPTSGKKEGSRTGSHFGISNSTCAGLTNSGAVKAGLKLNITLTNTSTTICETTSGSYSKSEGGTLKGSISASSTNALGGKSYPVKVREIFDLRMSETKGMKNIHVKVLYRDLVKIHQIYLNNNIIAGTTLLDHDSIYKIAYQPSQSTTSTTPTNLIVNVSNNNEGGINTNERVGNTDMANINTNEGVSNGDDDAPVTSSGVVQGVDLIKIYYSLYRKYRSSLQQLTHNQLYFIDPASLPIVDSENAFGPEDKDEEEAVESAKETGRDVGTESGAEESREGAPFDRNEEAEADLVIKVPGYAFVSRPINMALHLVSKESTRFSYSIESNESWFIEGLVVNNNVQLTEGKQHRLQFRLIPLREGRLEVPSVKFKGVKVEVPKKEVTVFPANYLLL